MSDQVSETPELWKQIGRGVFVGMWAWTVTAFIAYLVLTVIAPGIADAPSP